MSTFGQHTGALWQLLAARVDGFLRLVDVDDKTTHGVLSGSYLLHVLMDF